MIEVVGIDVGPDGSGGGSAGGSGVFTLSTTGAGEAVSVTFT